MTNIGIQSPNILKSLYAKLCFTKMNYSIENMYKVYM